jgi:hypothetical protein
VSKNPGVRIPIKSDGKTEVINDFAEIGRAGRAAGDEAGKGMEEAGRRSERALVEAAERGRRAMEALGVTATQGTPLADAMARDARAAQQALSVLQRDQEQFVLHREAMAQRLARVEAEGLGQSERAAALRQHLTELDRAYSEQLAKTADASGSVVTASMAMQEWMNAGGASLDESGRAAGDYEKMLRSLERALDEGGEPQRRYAERLEQISLLWKDGVIDAEHARMFHEAATRALQEETVALDKTEVSAGQLRLGYRSLSSQVRMFIDQVIQGRNPVEALAGRLGDTAAATTRLTGAKSAMGAVMSGPWGVAVTAGAALIGALTTKLMANTKELGANATAADRARVGANALGEAQNVLGGIFDLTTGKIKQQNELLLLNARLTAMNLRAEAQQRQASANDTFRQSVLRPGGAQRNLTLIADIVSGDPQRSMAGPNILREHLDRIRSARGADRAAALDRALRETEDFPFDKVTGITATQWRQAIIDIATATQNNDIARRIDSSLDNMVLDPGLRQEGRTPKPRRDRRAESLARQAASMEENIRLSIELANAYLQGGEAAIRAEAMRKGAVDATRRGIDVEAQIRRQLNLDIAKGVVEGAKAVSVMRDEASARERVNEQMSLNTLGWRDLDQALEREAALRPLLTLQSVAQGEALAALNRVIDAQTEAMERRDRAAARSDFIRAYGQLGNANMRAERLLAFAADDPDRLAIETAREEARGEALAKNWDPDDSAAWEELRVREAQLQIEHRRRGAIGEINRSLDDSLQLAEAELGMVRQSESARQAALRLLALQIDLRRQGIDLESEDAQAVLAKAEALEQVNAELRRQQAAWGEVVSIGSNFIDTVLSPDNWNDWGDLGRRIINDLIKDMLRLAAINPLKNLLFGTELPTLGGSSGVLGSVLGLMPHPGHGKPGGPLYASGGGAAAEKDALALLAKIPIGKFALGTEHASGGLALVGEFGPELAELPRGTKVRTAADTRRMMGADSRPSVNFTYNIDATGADAAGLARVEAKLEELRQEVPARAVAAWQDAVERNFIR